MFTLISSTNSEGKRFRPMSNGSSASPCTSFFNAHVLTYIGCFAPEVPILGTSNWNDTKLSNQIGAVSFFLSSFLGSFHFLSFFFRCASLVRKWNKKVRIGNQPQVSPSLWYAFSMVKCMTKADWVR